MVANKDRLLFFWKKWPGPSSFNGGPGAVFVQVLFAFSFPSQPGYQLQR
jgi:hypothetical protein